VARAAVLGRLIGRLAWRTATVREVVAESEHAVTLVLDVTDWPGHRAGQHVDVRLTADDGYQAERSYSISSAPEADAIAITVERIEDGEVSPYFTDVIRPGDQFELRGPVGGHFTWSVSDGGPILLVGGGSGFAPLMAMLRHRAAQDSDVEVHALVSARTDADALYRDELAALGPAEGLHVAWTFTRGGPPGWTGYTRRVDAAMIAEVGPAPARAPRCFVCGPTPFVEWVTGLLVDAGHDPQHIHAERFGPTGGRA